MCVRSNYMKIDAISAYQSYLVKSNFRIKNSEDKEEQVNAVPVLRVSFKGNPDKNPAQIAAFATEICEVISLPFRIISFCANFCRSTYLPINGIEFISQRRRKFSSKT